MVGLLGLVDNHNLLHDGSLFDFIYDCVSFKHFTKYGVVAVEVLGVLPVVADKKLRSAGIPAGMRHGKHASIVHLVVTSQFTIDIITRAAIANAIGTSALNHEVWNDPMKNQSVIEPFFGQVCKILNCFGSILLEKLNFHHSLFCVDFSYLHSFFSLII